MIPKKTPKNQALPFRPGARPHRRQGQVQPREGRAERPDPSPHHPRVDQVHEVPLRRLRDAPVARRDPLLHRLHYPGQVATFVKMFQIGEKPELDTFLGVFNPFHPTGPFLATNIMI